MKRISLVAVTLLMIFSAVLSTVQKVKAAPVAMDCTYNQFGRCASQSYYNGKAGYDSASTNWIWPTGHDGSVPANPNITDVDMFVNQMRNDLFNISGWTTDPQRVFVLTTCGSGPSAGACILDRGTLLGTAFMINTMLGNNGNVAAWNNPTTWAGPSSSGDPRVIREMNAIHEAQNRFAEWENIVRYYANNGMVEWDKIISYNLGDTRLDTVTIDFGTDIANYVNTFGPTSDRYIQFHNTDGSVYTINKKCGNVTGNNKPLYIPPPANFTTTATPQLPTLDDEESPKNVTFDANVKTTIAVNSVVTKRKYYAYKGATNPSLGTFPDQTVNVTPAGINLNTVTIDVTSFGLTAGDTICQSITVKPKSGTADLATHVIVIDDGESAPVITCKPIGNHPLVTFNGGDVSAGNGVGAGCTPLAADIKAYNQNAAPAFAGSGVELAAFATGTITGFRTNFSTANAPVGLSFANIGNALNNNGTNDFGGNFGNPQCIIDYYAKATDPASGLTLQTGTITIGGASATTPAKNVILVNGDVIINNDIYLNSSSVATRANLPYLWVITNGNIYVQPGVHHIEGIFIAQNGFIDTCADGTAAWPATQLYDKCGGGTNPADKLTINGAFITKKVKLNRAHGRLKDNTSGEVFNFGPLYYMNSPDFLNTPISNPNAGKFDTYTILPPVL